MKPLLPRSIARIVQILVLSLLFTGSFITSSAHAEPDLIVHHGKIVTVDPKFAVVEAMAVSLSPASNAIDFNCFRLCRY